MGLSESVCEQPVGSLALNSCEKQTAAWPLLFPPHTYPILVQSLIMPTTSAPATLSVNTLPGSLSDLLPEKYPILMVADIPLLPVTLPCRRTQSSYPPLSEPN